MKKVRDLVVSVVAWTIVSPVIGAVLVAALVGTLGARVRSRRAR